MSLNRGRFLMQFCFFFLFTFAMVAQKKLEMVNTKEKGGQFFVYKAKVLPGITFQCDLTAGHQFTTLVIKVVDNDCVDFANSYVVFDSDTIRLRKEIKNSNKKSELSSQFLVSKQPIDKFILFTDRLDGRIVFYFLNNQVKNEK